MAAAGQKKPESQIFALEAMQKRGKKGGKEPFLNPTAAPLFPELDSLKSGFVSFRHTGGEWGVTLCRRSWCEIDLILAFNSQGKGAVASKLDLGFFCYAAKNFPALPSDSLKFWKVIFLQRFSRTARHKVRMRHILSSPALHFHLQNF